MDKKVFESIRNKRDPDLLKPELTFFYNGLKITPTGDWDVSAELENQVYQYTHLENYARYVNSHGYQTREQIEELRGDVLSGTDEVPITNKYTLTCIADDINLTYKNKKDD